MMSTTMVALLIGTLGTAYGPGVHVREADLYVEQNPEWADPALSRYVRLGAVFPDLRSGGVALPVNTHDKALGATVLAVAQADGDLWKVAFAHGYRLHTASDTAAQVFYLPWLNAATDLQQVNLFGVDALGPVGDNELLIEGYGDLHSGSLQAFVDMAYDFLFGTPEDLDAVVDFFITALATHVGDELDAAAARAEVDAFWSSVESTLTGLDPGFVAMIIEESADLSISEVIGLLTSGLFADLLGSVPGTDGEIVADPHEMARLEAHPAGADPGAFFGAYEEIFATVGVTILGDDGYADWPWYRDVPIVAGVVQGFALQRPDRWAHHPEILLWRAGFEDGQGAAISTVPAEGAKTIRAVSELYLALDGPPQSVTFEVVTVRAGVVGDAPSDSVVAAASGLVSAGSARTVLMAEFELEGAPPDALGYALRWRVGDEVLPFLETHWTRYAVFADAPLFRPSYAEGIRAYLPVVTITRETPVQALGWVRGHAVLPTGHRGIATTVTASVGATAEGQPGGGFFLGELPPGEVTVTAEAPGYRGGPEAVSVAAGAETVVRLDLRAVPTVESGAWSPHADKLVVTVGLEHFAEPPTELDLSVREVGGGSVIGTWTGSAPAESVTIAFDTAWPDGTELVASVVTVDGDSVEGAVVTIDSSPPEAPTVTWQGSTCEAPFEVTLSALDDLAPVTDYEVRLAESEWRAVDAAGQGTLEASSLPEGPVRAEARARNASGLWSEVTVAVLCDVAPDLSGPDGSSEAPPERTPDVYAPGPTPERDSVASSVADGGDAASASSGGGGGGCRGGPVHRSLGWGTLLLALALLQRSRARDRCREVPQGVVRGVFVGHGE